MWVSRNKIISSTQKKAISKREDYSQTDDADLIAPRCLFLRKTGGIFLFFFGNGHPGAIETEP